MLFLPTSSKPAPTRPGVVESRHTVRERSGRPHVMVAVTIDRAMAGGRFITTNEDQRGLTTAQFAARSGAAVAINGDLFERGFRPRGLAVGANGRIWSTALERALPYFAILSDGQPAILSKGAPLPAGVQGAVAGKRDMLVHGGQAIINTVAGKALERAQQSAIGLTADGRVVIVTVSGREDKKFGVGLDRNELAQKLQSMGLNAAIELDGGGSASLVVHGKVTGGSARVANHIGWVPSSRVGV